MSAEEPRAPANPALGAGGSEDLPRTFGRYVLFDLVGRGGMAEIFLAKARTTEAGASRLVVVKQILPELSASPRFGEAFVQEAKLAARLSHANVVQVIDLGRAPYKGSLAPPALLADGSPTSVRPGDPTSRLFITMEYVEGLDLNELLRRCARTKVPLPIEFALLVVMETLRGLDYAHRRTDDAGQPLGIVHRDVSPSNVLVSVDGEVKLCDFGIARAMMADPPKGSVDPGAASEAIQGKAGYMSPEHARGEPLDARADVFAAGVILWELLSGRRLYKADKDKNESLLAVARRAEIPDVVARGLPYEEELHAILRRALAVDRTARFESAATMLDALQGYVAKARLVASPIRFGEWLTQHFGAELVEQRRARERAVKALELGPAATVTPQAPAAKPRREREAKDEDKDTQPVKTKARGSLPPAPRVETANALARVDTDPRTSKPSSASAPGSASAWTRWLLVALLALAAAIVAFQLLRR